MKIDIYVRAMCPLCDQVTDYLDQHMIPYNSYVVDHMQPHEITDLITNIAPGAKNTPVILVENRERTIDELRAIVESKKPVTV